MRYIIQDKCGFRKRIQFRRTFNCAKTAGIWRGFIQPGLTKFWSWFADIKLPQVLTNIAYNAPIQIWHNTKIVKKTTFRTDLRQSCTLCNTVFCRHLQFADLGKRMSPRIWFADLRSADFKKVCMPTSCAAKAFYSCPAIISRRLESQKTPKEPQLNPEEESRII